MYFLHFELSEESIEFAKILINSFYLLSLNPLSKEAITGFNLTGKYFNQ